MSGIVERVYAHILEQILSGALAAGTHLREVEIASALGTSRTPVREALMQLEAEGLVVTNRNTGAMVASFSRTDAEEIYWMRATLEGRAAGLAARRIDKDEIARLEALCGEMEALGEKGEIDLSIWGSLNTQFHLTLAAAAGSRVLLGQIRSLVRLPIVLLQAGSWSRDLHHAVGFAQHRDLLHALATGNAGFAEAQMRAHILAAVPRWVRETDGSVS
jgi:DNA-binding GntR family transcriptional regulator